LFTTYDSKDITTRVLITASEENGLLRNSYVMTDKIVTVDKGILGDKIGVLTEKDMEAVSRQLRIILGL
jgi:mRNA interferase MazF